MNCSPETPSQLTWALFLGYHGYYDQFSGQMITKYYHSCHKQLSKATISDGDLSMSQYIYGKLFRLLHPSVHLPCSSFSFFHHQWGCDHSDKSMWISEALSVEKQAMWLWFSHCHSQESVLWELRRRVCETPSHWICPASRLAAKPNNDSDLTSYSYCIAFSMITASSCECA